MVDRKPEPTLLPTQRILKLPHHIDMLREQLAFADADKWYTVVEIQIGRGDCMGNQTTNTQIWSPTSKTTDYHLTPTHNVDRVILKIQMVLRVKSDLSSFSGNVDLEL